MGRNGLDGMGEVVWVRAGGQGALRKGGIGVVSAVWGGVTIMDVRIASSA